MGGAKRHRKVMGPRPKALVTNAITNCYERRTNDFQTMGIREDSGKTGRFVRTKVSNQGGFESKATVTIKLRSQRFVRTIISYEYPCLSIVFPNFHCLKIVRTALVAVRYVICDQSFTLRAATNAVRTIFRPFRKIFLLGHTKLAFVDHSQTVRKFADWSMVLSKILFNLF